MDEKLLKDVLTIYGPLWHKAWSVYFHMKQRCRSPRSKGYKDYGGRGIELRMTEGEFIAWYVRVAEGRLDLTVDRIDNDGHYELSNLQLLTNAENVRKMNLESPRSSANTGVGARAMQQARRRPVWVGGEVFPSLAAAGQSLASRFGRHPRWVEQRLKRQGALPDGTLVRWVS